VVTIHDASFARFPEFAEARNLRYLRARIPHTVRRADAIITDSRFSAQEVQDAFGADPSKVFAVYPGVGPEMRPADPGAMARARALLGFDGPYLLAVGTIEPRKNLPFLVSVFERLSSFDGRLIVAGMPGWRCEPILERMRTSPRASRIRYVQYVPDDVLPALYSGASLFLFPSLYEGFGFPPLEAMACRTPVISSTGGSLAEVLSSGAILLKDYDEELWAERIQSVLSDASLRERMAAQGAAQAARYRWEDTARRTWEIYEKVCA
jgi:alpha-1,3-rhamnosyl/mannosyltransferase